MKLSTRLVIAMLALVFFTAAAVGLLAYRDLEGAILPRALERLQTHATLRAVELEAYTRGAPADVLGFRAAVAIEGIIRAHYNGGIDPQDGMTETAWRERMARRFSAELESKPAYLQFRIIALDDGGRELVRVDRSSRDGSIRIVPDAELERRGDRTFFREAMATPKGFAYFSPVELNRDGGAIEEPHVPVLHVATPLFFQDGPPFGIIVINVDMRPAFEQLRGNEPLGGHAFLVNEHGDYLVNPDARLEFGFEFGSIPMFEENYPKLQGAPASTRPSAAFTTAADGTEIAIAVAPAAFSNKRRVVVLETLPYATVMAPVYAARNSVAIAATAALFAAFLIALLLARSLTQPLAQMTAAVRQLGRGEAATVPIAASGEIGVLARAFRGMIAEVDHKTTELEREVTERRRMFDTSPDLILVVDRRGIFLRVSPSAREILGYQPEEMIGRNGVDFLYPGDLQHTRNEMRAARRGRLTRNFVTRYVHQDGHVVPLTWNGVWSEPAQQHFFIGRDMSEQQRQEEKFRLAVETCPNGMIMTDGDGKIVMVNGEVERLFGYSRDELIGMPADTLVPMRMKSEHMAYRTDRESLTDQQPIGTRREFTGQRRDRSEFPIEIGVTAIQTNDARLTLSVVVDITDRKRNERLKDEFVATVSHELRTPLTSIAASLGLLTAKATGEIAEPTMRLLKIAHKNSERLVRLINDVLDIEKIESGKIALDFRKVDLVPVVAQAIDANRGFAENFGVSVVLTPDIPSAFVRADIDRLTQVITNLLSNAVKFSPKGGKVEVSTTLSDHSITLNVRDHGVGIPEEFKPRIFEKFAQADATDARQKGGTGLGLSIVKQIVTLFDGAVGFETPADGGTRFFVELPRWEALAFTDRRRVNDRRRGGQVLICDDDQDVAAVIAERLRVAGFTSDIAASAHEAAAIADARLYDAILVDLSLPDGDGISLIQELRAQPQNASTPIVVISFDTARGREDVRSSSLDVLDWLDKPIDIGRLVTVLKRPLANGGGRPRLLHVDDDPDVLAIVAQALSPLADVISADSLADARALLVAERINLVVLDIALATDSGLDLLPDLRDDHGDAIPVIIYSAQGANRANAAHVHAVLTKSLLSIDSLIATLHRHIGEISNWPKDKEVA